MKLYAQSKRFRYRNVVLSLVIFAAIICAFVFSLNNISANAQSESKKAAENAIQKAIVTCYSVEGMYPENIEYLEEHYGIQIDRTKYVVNYQTIGSNVMPYVELVAIGTESYS